MRQVSELGGWPVWWPDGKHLGFQMIAPDGSEEVVRVPFAGGRLVKLPGLHFTNTNNPFDISPDGRLLAAGSCTNVSSEIWLLRSQR
jgi:hypothetical protein